MAKKVKSTPRTSANKARKAMKREIRFEKNRKKRQGYRSKRAYLRAIKFGKIKEVIES